ncbi:MAG: TonB family protein [Terracidiphilus sp.]
MNTAIVRSDWVGRDIDGRFILLQWLGGSERGGVYLTELEESGRQKAAIKLLPADDSDAEAQIADWALAATLSHPHLVRLFHSGRGQIGNTPLLYVVMEYAEEVLSQVLAERPLTPAEAREMLDPVLDSLSYLHGAGFVHGHLKPSNIVVVNDQLKLSSDSLHVAGELWKHPATLTVSEAPENAAAAITPAADLWSLGVTLVEALTQHPPAWDRSAKTQPLVPVFIPQPFAGIARDCLRPDPQLRCTLSEVKTRLKPAPAVSAPSVPAPAITTRRSATTVGSATTGRSAKTGRSATGKPRVKALVAVAVVLIAVAAGLLLRSRQTNPGQSAGVQQAEPAGTPADAGSQVYKGAVVKGAVTQQVMPEVLPAANASIRGTFQVSVRVTVDPDGNVSNAAWDSHGPSRYFANQALQAAQHWRFKAAQADGKAVPSVWILRFQFSQGATSVLSEETAP